MIICGRRENRLKEAQQKLPGIHYKVCDVSKTGEREKLAEWTVKNFPTLNILINNAGLQHKYDLKKTVCTEALELEMATNFNGPVHLNSLLVEHLTGKKEAAIINVSSGLAFVPLALMPVYCATKAALHSFTLSLRHQLAKTTIKVFEILPPMVDTELDGGDRNDRENTDRGMKADEFALLAIEALKNDVYEAAIGSAEYLRKKREGMFDMLNH